MTIQAVSFGKTAQTKQGNKYNKTKAFTYTGLGVGGAIAAFNTVRYSLYMKDFNKKLTNIINTNYNLLKDFIPDIQKPSKKEMETAFKIIKRELSTKLAVKSAIIIGIGAGLGTAADYFINKTRAKNADKPIMLKEQK